MNLCRDCKHSTPRYANMTFCTHPQNIAPSAIDGEQEMNRSASNLRENEKQCGPLAQWFEPKVQT